MEKHERAEKVADKFLEFKKEVEAFMKENPTLDDLRWLSGYCGSDLLAMLKTLGC